MNTARFLLTLLWVLAVAACGDGGGYGGGGSVAEPAIYSISGTVSGASSAIVTGVTITVSGTTMTATTDATGKYSVPNLANGTYTVTPSKTGYTYTPSSTSVTISGNNPSGVDFASS